MYTLVCTVWLDGKVDGQDGMNRWMHGWKINVGMDEIGVNWEQLDGKKLDSWMDGWMDGWMDEWMDG